MARQEDSRRWILENVEIDKMMGDVPINDQESDKNNLSPRKKCSNDINYGKHSGNLEKHSSINHGNIGKHVKNPGRSSSNLGTSLRRSTSNFGESVRRTTSNALRKSGILPPIPPQQKIERSASSVARGLKSLRFLDRTVTGKEMDAWRSIEKRFYQFAVDDRLSRDKFGVCIGEYFCSYYFFIIEQSFQAKQIDT